MLVYLVTAEHAYTMGSYLDTWGQAWRNRITVVSYADALTPAPEGWRARLRRRLRAPEAATWIFSDVERLLPAESEAAARLWDRLHAAGARLLNHPTRSMRRYELLRALHASGRNRFEVFRTDESRRPTRYPVFLRAEHDHTGPRTGLLADPAALDAALAALVADGTYREDKLIVEFCDTAGADGLYRKYSAFCVAGRILPRHLFFSNDWQVKAAVRYEPEVLAEERAYMDGNPHADAVAEVFSLARLDWGRIDYAIAGGTMQVWEINSNPMILTAAHAVDQPRRPVHDAFAAAFEAALSTLG